MKEMFHKTIHLKLISRYQCGSWLITQGQQVNNRIQDSILEQTRKRLQLTPQIVTVNQNQMLVRD